MKIFDVNDAEILSPDLSLGYLEADTIRVIHPAIEAVAEVGHYEVVREYPNGGKEIQWVVDIPGVVGREAMDITEEIYRYILYTPEELEAIEKEKNKPTELDRIRELEEALELLLSGATE